MTTTTLQQQITTQLQAHPTGMGYAELAEALYPDTCPSCAPRDLQDALWRMIPAGKVTPIGNGTFVLSEVQG